LILFWRLHVLKELSIIKVHLKSKDNQLKILFLLLERYKKLYLKIVISLINGWKIIKIAFLRPLNQIKNIIKFIFLMKNGPKAFSMYNKFS